MNHALRDLRCLALLAALTIGLPRHAASEPTITGPTAPVPVGGFCDVTISGLDNKDALSWVTVPEIPVRVYAVWGSGDPILSVPTNAPGSWTMVIGYVDGGKPVLKKVVLVIGTGPTPPVPIPVPDVPPPPVPQPSGKRVVLLIRETADTTPEMARLVTALRTGENAAYITSKGHKLSILDDDSVDAAGNPTPILAAWRPHFADLDLPAVIIYDPATKQLVHRQAIPATAKAADVMAILKGHE